ncbi:unnamed protein product [Rotaria sordida]|uniref:ABC-2 type transporter transmembrane domain-containing protein n=1 Tax=Rotaria sordida TaxID=392033 RepID=A0A819S5T2_9BILA|nr:unnamed protein product [Rotaria sordida]CAF4064572.1 unnamed protein product [Rotaria sordida]
MFDTVMFMCNGRCVYHGSPKSVIPYFEKYGYHCDPYENPADYISDVLIDIATRLMAAEIFYLSQRTLRNAVHNPALALSQTVASIVIVMALIIVIFILVIMMMFSGFLIDLPSMFSWLSWIQWISAFRYASNVLTINEFQDLLFRLANETDICSITGDEILDKRGLVHANAWDLWKNFFALTMMAMLLFILTYIQLIRIKKIK